MGLRRASHRFFGLLPQEEGAPERLSNPRGSAAARQPGHLLDLLGHGALSRKNGALRKRLPANPGSLTARLPGDQPLNPLITLNYTET